VTAAGLRRASDIGAAAQLACLLEVSASKPGNVTRDHRFADLGYEDFLASAAAIGAPLAGAGERPLGATVRWAIEATRRWCRTNSNLGIVLLLAPLARAASAVPEGGMLRDAVRRVLDESTVDDARDVYAAIRLASPGGLGRVDDQDVGREPDVTLLEAMRLAAGRDGIAGEYATAFAVTFETGVPALEQARRDGLTWDAAIVETFLTLLARSPDTHVARRSGTERAVAVTAQAQAALAAGGVRTLEGRAAIAGMDQDLRDARHAANPGTTADLTAAAIFVTLLTGRWSRSGDG
jgi:triphosphoribosyl-dephospho-CoA synthase